MAQHIFICLDTAKASCTKTRNNYITEQVWQTQQLLYQCLLYGT